MDNLTSDQRSKQMSLVRYKDTRPELVVRKLVHSLGFRYRLHGQGLPGKPDLVFSRRKKVIFVHGCFWHQHKDQACRLARLPKSRLEFWIPKLSGNQKRDVAKQQELHKLGWHILVIWECQIKNATLLTTTITKFLGHEIN